MVSEGRICGISSEAFGREEIIRLHGGEHQDLPIRKKVFCFKDIAKKMLGLGYRVEGHLPRFDGAMKCYLRIRFNCFVMIVSTRS